MRNVKTTVEIVAALACTLGSWACRSLHESCAALRQVLSIVNRDAIRSALKRSTKASPAVVDEATLCSFRVLQL